MIPPSTMPSMAPLVHPSERYPNAVPRTLGGNVSAMIAPLFAWMSAPPTAWNPPGGNQPIDAGGEAAEERAEREDAEAGIEHPAPAIDVPDPAELGGADRDDKKVDVRIIQSVVMKAACREAEMVGNASMTIVESSDPMSVPSMRTEMMIFCLASIRNLLKYCRGLLMYLSNG